MSPCFGFSSTESHNVPTRTAFNVIYSGINSTCRTVLIAGAGYVSLPVGDILAKNGAKVIFGCRTLKTAQQVAAKVTGGKASAIELDVRNAQQLSDAVAKCDLVVSLVPPPDHPHIVEAAIKHKVPALTTSYVSPEMAALEPRVKEAGILVMNEIGLDPGLDHLWAVKCLEDIVAAGGKCTSFESYCGGLPAPECSDNALGYRFSWSSSGVLRALNRVAKYKQDGKTLELGGVDLMSSAKRFVTPFKGYAFECYANGDSLPYDTRYPGLKDAHTIVRGSLRYEGFASICKCLIQLGFLDMTEQDFLKSPMSWNEATAKIIGAKSSSEQELAHTVLAKAQFSGASERDAVLRGLKEIGIFSAASKTIPQREPSAFFTLCALLEQSCMYGAGQRDLIFLQHTFHVDKKDGGKSVVMATLAEYGDPEGHSAMAKLVGTPAAVACLAILRGEIADSGLLSPVTERVARPLREALEREFGITMNEVELPA